MECIVLAGGLGTRLQTVINDIPKCMADISGKPFLSYLFEYLENQGCQHVILSLGYQHEEVLSWINTKAFTFKISWVIEKESLGTGGAIRLALNKAKTKKVFVLNGDTIFNISLKEMYEKTTEDIALSIALKKMDEIERYGTVSLDENHLVTAFHEKEFTKDGLINGGIYLINTHIIPLKNYPEKFSFETEYLQIQYHNNKFLGIDSNAYFIDIGIPEDYARAQIELPQLFS